MQRGGRRLLNGFGCCYCRCNMRAIQDERISCSNGKFVATCVCGSITVLSHKSSASRMVARGVCRSCKKDYRSVKNLDTGIYQRNDKKWCSRCSACGCEQAYTRKDHAKQSSVDDWLCKKCVCLAKSFSANTPVGAMRRIFNRTRTSAISRGIPFELEERDLLKSFTGFCFLTGWEISTDYKNGTASIDRIDSSKGYTRKNIQWVHSIVNMMKNKYSQQQFVEMCLAVAKTHSVTPLI